MQRGLVLLFATAVVAGAGCAVPKDAGFADVRQSVAARLDRTVEWTRDTPEDTAVAAQIVALLDHQLTVDGAIQIALLNNQQLQAVYEDLGVAQAAVVQAGLLKNPVFDAAVRLRIDGGPVNPEFAVAEDFLGVLFIPMRKRIASAEFEAAKQHVTGAVLDLAGEVRAACYQLQAELQLLELERAVMDAGDAAADAAARLHTAGNLTDLELASEEALAAQTRLDVAATEAHVVDLRERLNSLLGLWGTQTGWALAARLPDLPEQEMDLTGVERRAVTASLDLAELREDVAATRERLGLARVAGPWPSLDFGVMADRDDGAWELGPSLALPLPLFDQGQAQVAASAAELRRTERRFHALAVQLRAAVRAARNRIVAARQRAAYYQRVLLPLRQRVLAQTQLEYNGMLVGVFQLLQAKQQEIDSGKQYVDALRDYWIARAQLTQILDGRLPHLAPGIGLPIPATDEPVMSGETLTGGH